MTLPTMDRFRGCLLAGAVGDGLGAAVEFHQLDQIHARGVPETNLRITDDTQMTLFTGEGIIRAHVRGRSTGIVQVAPAVHRAYLRWLATQQSGQPITDDGWLFAQDALHVRRAPGSTCLSALTSGRMGSPTV